MELNIVGTFLIATKSAALIAVPRSRSDVLFGNQKDNQVVSGGLTVMDHIRVSRESL